MIILLKLSSLSKQIISWSLFSLFLGSSFAAAQDTALRTKIKMANSQMGEKIALICFACHSFQQGESHKVGPNLWDIVDSPQASRVGFAYSANFQKLNKKWSLENLNQFLLSPTEYVPGTIMVFPGVQERQQRMDLLAFLTSLSDKPSLILIKPASNETSSSVAHSFGKDWPQGEGALETGYTCAACHSLAIVKQQGLTKADWDELIDWMIEEQEMDELAPELRAKILTYLALNFNPETKTAKQ